MRVYQEIRTDGAQRRDALIGAVCGSLLSAALLYDAYLWLERFFS